MLHLTRTFPLYNQHVFRTVNRTGTWSTLTATQGLLVSAKRTVSSTTYAIILQYTFITLITYCFQKRIVLFFCTQVR